MFSLSFIQNVEFLSLTYEQSSCYLSIQTGLKTFSHISFQFEKKLKISVDSAAGLGLVRRIGIGRYVFGSRGALRYSFVGPNSEGSAPGKPFGERSWQRPSPLIEQPGVCATRKHT